MVKIYGLVLLLDLAWTYSPDLRPSSGHGPVFLSQDEAQQVLVRRRRANSFLEEMKQGNMERECVEEVCDKEEAREIFENEELTNEFWAKYKDGDACESTPCLNQGSCKDTAGGYLCFCRTGYKGSSCEIVIPELCETQNGGCQHFCEVESGSVHCSCADGYELGPDHQSCISTDPFKCGVLITDHTRTVFVYDRNQTLNRTQDQIQISLNTSETNSTNSTQSPVLSLDPSPIHTLDSAENSSVILGQEHTHLGLDLVQEEKITSQMATWTRIVNGEDCPPGECPWQALLLNEEHRGFCGGTILNNFIILTAAHCMNQSRHIYVVLGEFDTLVKDGNEAVHQVEKVLIHQKYRPETYLNDIALIKLRKPITYSRFIIPACLPTKDFAEKVLMRENDGLVSGFGRLGEFSRPSQILQRLAMPYVDRARCLAALNFWISTRMFCAGYEEGGKDACQGDSGGPHVTRFGGTYFVTGIVSWGEGCARAGKFGVYTQVSKYIRWIRDGMRLLVRQPKKKRSSGSPQDQTFEQDRARSKRSGPGQERTRRPRGFHVLYL